MQENIFCIVIIQIKPNIYTLTGPLLPTLNKLENLNCEHTLQIKWFPSQTKVVLSGLNFMWFHNLTKMSN